MHVHPEYLTVNSLGNITDSCVSSDLVKFLPGRKIQDYISFEVFENIKKDLESAEWLQRVLTITGQSSVVEAKTTWRHTENQNKIVYIEDLSILENFVSSMSNDYDSMLYTFLSEKLVQLDLSNAKYFKAHCKTRFVAHSLAKSAGKLLDSGYEGVQIYLEGRKYPYLLKEKRGAVMRSATDIQVVSSSCKWLGADANRNVFDAMKGILKVYDVSNRDYVMKAIRPEISERRLNKPIADSIGKPLSVIDSEISEKIRWHLDRVTKTGLNQSFSYSHYWDDREWFFTVNMANLIGYSEVLACTDDDMSDLERYVSQKKYWLDLVNSPSQ